MKLFPGSTSPFPFSMLFPVQNKFHSYGYDKTTLSQDWVGERCVWKVFDPDCSCWTHPSKQLSVLNSKSPNNFSKTTQLLVKEVISYGLVQFTGILGFFVMVKFFCFSFHFLFCFQDSFWDITDSWLYSKIGNFINLPSLPAREILETYRSAEERKGVW